MFVYCSYAGLAHRRRVVTTDATADPKAVLTCISDWSVFWTVCWTVWHLPGCSIEVLFMNGNENTIKSNDVFWCGPQKYFPCGWMVAIHSIKNPRTCQFFTSHHSGGQPDGEWAHSMQISPNVQPRPRIFEPIHCYHLFLHRCIATPSHIGAPWGAELTEMVRMLLSAFAFFDTWIVQRSMIIWFIQFHKFFIMQK